MPHVARIARRTGLGLVLLLTLSSTALAQTAPSDFDLQGWAGGLDSGERQYVGAHPEIRPMRLRARTARLAHARAARFGGVHALGDAKWTRCGIASRTTASSASRPADSGSLVRGTQLRATHHPCQCHDDADRRHHQHRGGGIRRHRRDRGLAHARRPRPDLRDESAGRVHATQDGCGNPAFVPSPAAPTSGFDLDAARAAGLG